MRRLIATALVALFCMLPTISASSGVNAVDGAKHGVPVARTGVELISETPGRTVIKLTASGTEDVSTIVRVPDTGRIRAEVSDLEVVGAGGLLVPSDGFEIADLVTLSTPAIMRDIRIVRVTLSCQGTELTDDATAFSATVAVTTDDAQGTNEKRYHHAWPSPAFDRIYRQTVLNYEHIRHATPEQAARSSRGGRLPGRRDVEGARYVIIADQTLADLADSLVQWKGRKGLIPMVVTPPQGTWTRYEIYQYIENAYHNWDVPPEFVLLLGDTELVPTGGGEVKTDNYYAAVEGDDYLLDILVGRLPADNAEEARLMLAKTLAYDRPWLHDESVWPTSAALIVREDEQGGNEIYYENSAYIRGLMEDAGYAHVDTLFTRNWSTAENVYTSLAEGRGFLNYRGSAAAFWIPPFQVLPWETESRWELPIVVSATCLTGDYYGDESVCEYFLQAGDVQEPRGGVAFFGTSTHGLGPDLSQRRAWIDEGFFDGVFGEGRTLGEACAAGKTNLYVNVDDIQEYRGWNLLGDPELSVWTATSSPLEIAYEEIVSENEAVEVTVTSGGEPVEGAVVTVDSVPLAFAMGLTDASGAVELPLSCPAPCTLRLVATTKDARPAEGVVRVLGAGPHVLVEADTVDDSEGGNGDGLASPGEALLLSLALVNLGDASAYGIEARLSSPDGHVSMIDSVATFDRIPADSTAWSENCFEVAVEADWPGGYSLPLDLTVSYGDSVDAFSLPPLATVTGDLSTFYLSNDDGPPGGDGDGRLDPGEVAGLVVTLEGEAASALTGVSGRLSSRNPDVTVTAASGIFPDIDPGAHGANSGGAYVVSISPNADPGDALLFMRVTAEAATYSYAETLRLDIDITEVPPLHATGPDNYGYYAYDSSDTLYEAAPDFEWTEIAPPGPGVLVDDINDASNAVKALAAPFVVKYYGVNHFTTSVCSNGFVSLYITDFRWGDNSGIPELHGAPAMLAPFWDDLDPSAGGSIYSWHDVDGHRLIVEYDEVRHADSEDTETFQVVIHDPVHYPTPTGDAPILFLFKEVGDAGDCTVGIENPYQTVGSQFLFDGDYGDYAAELTDGLAVLFTTDEPETLRVPWLVLDGAYLDDSEGGNGDGEPGPGEELRLVVALRNDGQATATGLELSLSEESSGITVIDGAVPLDDVPPGSSAQNADDPFVFAVDEAAADSLVTFWISPGPESNARQGAVRLDVQIGRQPEPVASRLLLGPCQPNPFTTRTEMSFSIPNAGHVTARVYDVAGRLVKTIEDSQHEAGPAELEWDGSNGAGEAVASGIYFLRLTTEGDSRTRKVVLLR